MPGLDEPFAIDAMRITALAHGYVVNALGETFSCETPASLARTVKKWAERMESRSPEFLGVNSPPGLFQQPPMPAEAETVWPPERVETPTMQEWQEGSIMEKQYEQLDSLIEALYEGFISDEQFGSALGRACPDISGEAVCAKLDEMHGVYTAGSQDHDDEFERHKDRVQRRIRGELRLLPVDVEETGGDSGHGPDGDPNAAPRDDIPPGGVTTETPGEQAVEKDRPENKMRRASRLLVPGTYSDPRPEDVDRYDS